MSKYTKQPETARHTKKMKVVEKFISINGEGSKAGELSVFIRFKGCNLNCSYCDTKWANESECGYEELSPYDILLYILSSDIKNVTLTGGEPLLQRDMPLLLDILGQYRDIYTEIETNGSVDLAPFTGAANTAFTMDYKLPSSGMEDQMLLSNLEILRPEDTVKFVAGSSEDLDKARLIVEKYGLTDKCRVYFSPVFGQIDPADIVGYMAEHKLNKVRMQLQMHKFIWAPDKRGV